MKVKIEYINDAGLGVAFFKDKKVFVPFTIDGEEVLAETTQEKRRYFSAELKDVITHSPDRATPPCIYYQQCGGCNLQHLNAEKYQAYKTNLLNTALTRAGFEIPNAKLYIIGDKSRRRTSFKVNGTRIGYFKAGSHELVDIDYCLVLEDELNHFNKELRLLLKKLGNHSITEIILTHSDNGIDLTLNITDALSLEAKQIIINFANKHDLSRVSSKFDHYIEAIITRRMPLVNFGNYQIELPVGAFLQVSKKSQQIIADLIIKHAANYRNIADLFAGCGTYSFTLAGSAKISAYEGDGEMVKTINKAAQLNKLAITATERDLYKNPLKQSELSNFDLVVINPPRNGAEPQIVEIKKRDVILVSCDPSSFTRDARILKQSGYILKEAYGIDQVHFSNHLEILAIFHYAR